MTYNLNCNINIYFGPNYSYSICSTRDQFIESPAEPYRWNMRMANGQDRQKMTADQMLNFNLNLIKINYQRPRVGFGTNVID